MRVLWYPQTSANVFLISEHNLGAVSEVGNAPKKKTQSSFFTPVNPTWP